MSRKKTDLAIVNRSFWPDSQVIGEALLQFAEAAARDHSTCVITQSGIDLPATLAKVGRGDGLDVRACKTFTDSASGIVKRIAESIYFTAWSFYSLACVRPTTVYVSTNPPVIVPFVVALYCRLFRAEYVYHLQDIHPEAANIVVPLKPVFFKMLAAVDNYTLRHAKAVITLSEDMRSHLLARSETARPVYLLENPSVEIASVVSRERKQGIVFCGNAGRLQRIPLLLQSIRQYLDGGGKLEFIFAGGGLYAADIEKLAEAYDHVRYLGVLSPSDAADLVSRHQWALLPIDDEVTRYAFPSKSSGYALSGAGILAICGAETSVARWVTALKLGVVCEPELDSVVACFRSLEGDCRTVTISEDVRARLQIPHFAQELKNLCLSSASRKRQGRKC